MFHRWHPLEKSGSLGSSTFFGSFVWPFQCWFAEFSVLVLRSQPFLQGRGHRWTPPSSRAISVSNSRKQKGHKMSRCKSASPAPLGMSLVDMNQNWLGSQRGSKTDSLPYRCNHYKQHWESSIFSWCHLNWIYLSVCLSIYLPIYLI